jgi:hypothetical protein
LEKQSKSAIQEADISVGKWLRPLSRVWRQVGCGRKKILESFRLNPEQIEKIVAFIPPTVVEDIKFSQHQRASIRDIEVETLPGVILVHKTFP